jgi:hypothetical protein
MGLTMSEIKLTTEELEDMLDRSAKRGAKLVLRELGLQDETAAVDIREIRSLLDTWRQTRLSIWNTFIKITTIAVFTFIGAAIWMKIGN